MVSISLGDQHSVALTEESGSRRLYTWGSGHGGMLGLGDSTEDRWVPTLVDRMREEQVVAVSAGRFHTVAVNERGQLFTWGHGGKGMRGSCLGHGVNADPDYSVSTPRSVESPSTGIRWGAGGAPVGGAPAGAQPTAIHGIVDNLLRLEREIASMRRATDGQLSEIKSDSDLRTALSGCVKMKETLANTFKKIEDNVSAMQKTFESEKMHRRRCAETVAKANPDFICPISQSLMRDPVVAADGHSYERQRAVCLIHTHAYFLSIYHK